MSWRSHGRDNADMVRTLRKNKLVKSASVARAMEDVDRGFFVVASDQGTAAYRDQPQSIGSRATISAPHMHAYCLELLTDHCKPGARVLDVGSGSGYLTAVLAAMVAGEGGRDIGVEHIDKLVAWSLSNLKKDPKAAALVREGALEIHAADGRLGWPAEAPYDAIHVGAAAPEVPVDLTRQLKPGGRLVIPVGEEGQSQSLVVIDKREDGTLDRRRVMGVV